MSYLIKHKYKPFVFLLDLAGKIVFFITKLKKFPKKVNKILVIRLDHIGDVVLTTPLIKSLKINFPDSELHVLCKPSSTQILKNNKNVNKIIEYNSSWFSRESKTDKFFDLIKKLRKEKYDLILEPKGDPRNIILGKLTEGYLIGYGTRGLGFLLNKEVKWNGKIMHIVLRNLDLLKNLKMKISDEQELILDLDSEKNIQKIFKKHKIKKNDVVLCINVGVGAPEREWSIENFKGLITEILKKLPNSKILITDAKQEKTNKISESITDSRLIDLGGKLNLSELISLIHKSTILISLESASMHIAATVNTPVIDIHSAITHKEEWGPYTQNCIILQKFIGLYADTKLALKAINSITSKEVFESVETLLEQNK